VQQQYSVKATVEAVSSPDEDIATVNMAAEVLEGLVGPLELAMRSARLAKASLIDITPGAAREAGFTGSMEQFEAAIVERYGFNRLDRARRLLLEALSEPLDIVLPPDQGPTP
jgi:hypothetical protein